MNDEFEPIIKILEGYIDCCGHREHATARYERFMAGTYYQSRQNLDRYHLWNGHVMSSFWGLYQQYLSKTTGWRASIASYPLELLIEQLTNPYKTLMKEKIKKSSRAFLEFAELYCSPGNFLVFPTDKMRKPFMWAAFSRIDWFLYECFAGGSFGNFFKHDNKKLRRWITEQNLDAVFKHGIIRKNQINWFVDSTEPIYKWGSQDILTYVERATELIKFRS